LAISASPFPNDAIPASELNPISLKLLSFYPQATVLGSSIVGNYIRQGAHSTNEDEFMQRIDFNENTKSFWFGRFGWNDEFLRQTGTFANQEGKISTHSNQIMLSNTRTLGTTAVNEFRFGYTKFYNNLATYSAGVQNPVAGLGIIGLTDPGPLSWGTPSVTLGNGLNGFGETSDGPYVNQNHIFQWLDNFSVLRGRHSLKFGGDVRRDRLNQYGQVYLRGSFTFDGSATYNPASRGTTGFSLADFLLGDMQQFVKAPAAATVQGRDTSYSLYAEDTWKLTTKLTLTLALRYEVVPWPHDKYRSMMNMEMFDPGVGPNGVLPGTSRFWFVPDKAAFSMACSFTFPTLIPRPPVTAC
jgi:outer membrane receptor protein involved in Fe transport